MWGSSWLFHTDSGIIGIEVEFFMKLFWSMSQHEGVFHPKIEQIIKPHPMNHFQGGFWKLSEIWAHKL